MNKGIMRGGRLLVISLLLFCIVGSLFAGAAQGQSPAQGSATLTVRQVFTYPESSAAPPDESFTYKLTTELTVNPMPADSGAEGYLFTIAGTAEADIGPITFTQAGVYVYELRCVTNAAEGYICDRQVYKIYVYVQDDLAAYVVVYKDGGDKTQSIAFSHTYAGSPPETVTISGGKTWYHRTREDSVYIPDEKKPVSITLLVLADGEIVLKKLITAADRWSWSIEMDKYAPDGREIVYTVDEEVFYDYRKWVSGYSIINEYSPGDNTNDIPDVPPPLGPPDDGPGGPQVPVIPPQVSEPGKPGPITGDESNTGLYIILLCIAAVPALGSAVWLLAGKRRRKGCDGDET